MTTTEMIDSYKGMARGFASKMHRRMPPDVSFDDIYSPALEGLWRAAATWQPAKARFTTYAYMCMRRCVIDWLRTARLRRGQTYLRERTLASTANEDDPVLWAVAKDELEKVDQRDTIDHELAQLEPTQAALVRGHFLYGYTIYELAALLGKSPTHILHRLDVYRCRAGLKKVHRRPHKMAS